MRDDLYYSVVKKWFIFSVPFIFLLGAVFHFVFQFIDNLILAPFFPVNESIYEHLKLTFYPILIWQLIGYLFLKNRVRIILKNWVISNAISIILSSLLTIFLYYSAAGAFNIHSTLADICFYFISIALGQALGLHLYKNCDDNRNLFLLSIIIILCMFISFTIFTFIPPKLPLFMESSTSLYGI